MVSVPEIAGGYCQGMCADVSFSPTFLVNLRETPNKAAEKLTKASPVAPYVHSHVQCAYTARQQCLCMHGTLSKGRYETDKGVHRLICGSLASLATTVEEGKQQPGLKNY